jgi:hypothetical protein
MKDNDLIALFSSRLEEAIALAGWDVVVIQGYQPTQQGVPSKPTVSFEKLFDHEYGWPMSSEYVLDSTTPPGQTLPDFSQFEQQWVESTFQVTSLSIQDPTDLSIPTPSDIAHQLKLYMNARQTIWKFQKDDVAILRVTDIRNPKFEDDRDLFEANPNFDVILQHKRELVFKTPGSNEVIGDIIAVAEGNEVPV